VDEDAHHTKKSIQIVSEQGIKGPDTMANLVWANTFLGKYVNAYLGRHCYTQHVSTSYWSLYICSTIGKHALACNRHEIECFYCRRTLIKSASVIVCCTEVISLVSEYHHHPSVMHLSAQQSRYWEPIAREPDVALLMTASGSLDIFLTRLLWMKLFL